MSCPVIDENYELLRRLGKGGMAEVFLARLRGFAGLSKLVVIKRILPKKAQNGDFITMFLDEARVCADLSHPNVVQVFDINRADMTYYMAMEFVHGIDLRQLILKVLERREHIPIDVIAKIISMAAAGLDHVHKKKSMHGMPLNIVHRDISPQNILVSYAGHTKIADFGIARAELQNFDAKGRRLMGKYAYMSPEQAHKFDLDGRSDLYALAVVFWEMLALRRLFHEKESSKTLERVRNPKVISPKRFRKNLPSSIENVLMKALSPKKEDRFLDCDAFRVALEDGVAENDMLLSHLQVSEYLRKIFGAPETEEQLHKGQLKKEDIEMLSEKEAKNYTATALKKNPIFDADEKTEITRERSAKKSKKPKKRPVFSEVHHKDPKDTDEDPILNENRNPRRVKSRKNELLLPRFLQLIEHRRNLIIGFLFLFLVSVGFLFWLNFGRKDVAYITIRSEPTAANLYFEGKKNTVKTPYIMKGNVGGKVRLTLSLEGYKPRKTILFFKKKGRQNVFFELTQD